MRIATTLVAFAVCIPSVASGQPGAPAPTAPTPGQPLGPTQPSGQLLSPAEMMAENDARRLRASGRTRVTIGAALGLSGLAGVVAGSLLVRSGNRKERVADDPDSLDGLDEQVGGVLLLVFGTAVGVTGAIFLASGQDRLAEAKNRRKARVAVTPNGSGGVTALVSGSF